MLLGVNVPPKRNNQTSTNPMAQILPLSLQEQQNIATVSSTRSKLVKALRVLTVLQSIISLCILVLGSICVASTSFSPMGGDDDWGCALATGVWVGVFALVTSSFGVATAWLPRNQCLTGAYLVLCIIVSLFCIFMGCLSVEDAFYYLSLRSARWGNIALAILGIVFAVSAVLSSSLVCAKQGCRCCCTTSEQPEPTVTYVAAPINEPPPSYYEHGFSVPQTAQQST